MPETNRLYYSDSYRKEVQSKVALISEDGRKVTLEQTIFYPTSGGQPHDLGTLNKIPVVDVTDEASTITHVLADPLGETETVVHEEIDWARRYDHMQQHTGQHLLSAVFEELFGWKTISFSMGSRQSTIDLNIAVIEPQRIDDAILRTTELSRSNPAVTISYEDAASVQGLRKASDRSGKLRIVSIDGIDKSACGGTHVAHLAEVLPVQCLETEKIRGCSRLSFVCGDRAVRRIRADFEIINTLTRTMGVPAESLAAKAALLESRLAEAEKIRVRMENEAAFRAGADLHRTTQPGADNIRRVISEVLTIDDCARSMANGFCSQGSAVLLLYSKESLLLAASPDVNIDAGAELKKVLAKYGARGGGSPLLAQAKLTDIAMLNDLKAALNLGPKSQKQ